MIKHNLELKYFHGCGDCRDCCNGKHFSLGKVYVSDIKTISQSFPIIFNSNDNEFYFYYSVYPGLGCFYFRENNCTIYDLYDRPNTCLNYPFAFDEKAIVHMDTLCPQLNSEEGGIATINGDSVNPEIINTFFTEKQYVSIINNNENKLTELSELLVKKKLLQPIPPIKINNSIVDINNYKENLDMKIFDIDNIIKYIKNRPDLIEIVYLIKFSWEHFSKFTEYNYNQLK